MLQDQTALVLEHDIKIDINRIESMLGHNSRKWGAIKFIRVEKKI